MEVIVHIINWEKHNPRKDVKRPSWFAFDNRMVEDDDFFDFNHGEFKAWIYLLSKASQKQEPEVRVTFDAANRKSNISTKDFKSCIEKLEKLGIVTVRVTPTLRARDVDVTLQTDRQDKTDITNKQSLPKAVPKAVKKSALTESEALIAKSVREVYRNGYAIRYGVEKENFNAMENGQISKLVKRLGQDAPAVTAFYLTHSDQFYVKKSHSIGSLLFDAEALQTQWKTNMAITTAKAREIERGESSRVSDAEMSRLLGVAKETVNIAKTAIEPRVVNIVGDEPDVIPTGRHPLKVIGHD